MLSLSLCLIPGLGWVGHHPIQSSPGSSTGVVDRCHSVVGPSLVVCWALEDQVLRRFFSAVAVGTGG